MTDRDRRALLAVLGDPRCDLRVGFVEGQWVLATGEGDSYEVLVRHSGWEEFIKLIGEYADYEDGE